MGHSTRATAPTARFVPPETVADHLTISPASVQRLTASGDLPSVKIGKSIRYDLDDVDRAIRGLPPQPRPTTPEEYLDLLAVLRAQRALVAESLTDDQVQEAIGDTDGWTDDYRRHVAALIITAPPLSASQRNRLTTAMRGVSA